jgi:hypothetical protein
MLSPADIDLLRRFENCEVREEEWTHEAHVRVAWILLKTTPHRSAEQRLRAGILRHNTEVLGRPGRYHETVTVAFARIIRARLRSGETWCDFSRRCQDILSSGEPLLLRFYSPGLLHSGAARTGFIEPDRAPLPQQGAPDHGAVRYG